YTPEQLAHWQALFPRSVTDQHASSVVRAIATRSVSRVDDVETEAGLAAEAKANLRARGTRAVISVPMLRHGEPIGGISLAKGSVGGFSDAHVELLKTFADQAVIAIENARLLNELQSRNRDLGESLDRQTATAEILRVISTSPTD